MFPGYRKRFPEIGKEPPGEGKRVENLAKRPCLITNSLFELTRCIESMGISIISPGLLDLATMSSLNSRYIQGFRRGASESHIFLPAEELDISTTQQSTLVRQVPLESMRILGSNLSERNTQAFGRHTPLRRIPLMALA